jgi:transposase InsO family protein
VCRKAVAPLPLKRGPKTPLTDDEVLALIRTDLETSPFIGEGHRKVWARLRFVQEIKVGRKRVLRIMRENNLLSPHRVIQGQPKEHSGKIITAAPNVMWGTDGTKIFTLDEGWCWLFTAVEHWNAECVGWHVTKHGDRFAALQPLSMAIKTRYGSVDAGAARGLVLRMDHGTQYLSEHFQNQIKFWGIAPSFAFVAEPQTNGVTERFNRTLKEQVIYGHNYRNIEEVRTAVADFMDRYNRLWLVEKLGFRSPRQAFEDFQLKKVA